MWIHKQRLILHWNWKITTFSSPTAALVELSCGLVNSLTIHFIWKHFWLAKQWVCWSDQNRTILFFYFFLCQVHSTDLWKLKPSPTQFERLTLVTSLLWMGFFRYLIKKLCRKLEERKKAINGSSTTVINRKSDISAEHECNGLWVWYSEYTRELSSVTTIREPPFKSW